MNLGQQSFYLMTGLCNFCELRILHPSLLLSQIYYCFWSFLFLKEKKIRKKKKKDFYPKKLSAIIFIIYFIYRLLSIPQSITSNWWKFFLCINKISLMAISAIFRNVWKIIFLLMPESVTSFLWYNDHDYWILLPLQSTYVDMQLYQQKIHKCIEIHKIKPQTTES